MTNETLNSVRIANKSVTHTFVGVEIYRVITDIQLVMDLFLMDVGVIVPTNIHPNKSWKAVKWNDYLKYV